MSDPIDLDHGARLSGAASSGLFLAVKRRAAEAAHRDARIAAAGIRPAASAESIAESIADLRAGCEAAGPAERRALVQAIARSIVVGPRGLQVALRIPRDLTSMGATSSSRTEAPGSWVPAGTLWVLTRRHAAAYQPARAAS